MELVTIKTNDDLIIEYNNHSLAILEKYKDFAFKNDKALPVISNQKMNDYLKELGKLTGLNDLVREVYYKGNDREDEVTPKHELMTTHVGRRTFICRALSMGIPITTVMKWTGHSDFEAMKPYIGVADKDKQDAMQLWNKPEKKEVTKSDNLLELLKQQPKENIINLFTQLLS